MSGGDWEEGDGDGVHRLVQKLRATLDAEREAHERMRHCGEAEPVSGCDCNRCLVRAMQSCFLAKISAEAELAQAERERDEARAAVAEAFRIMTALIHDPSPLTDEQQRWAQEAVERHNTKKGGR